MLKSSLDVPVSDPKASPCDWQLEKSDPSLGWVVSLDPIPSTWWAIVWSSRTFLAVRGQSSASALRHPIVIRICSRAIANSFPFNRK